MQLLKEFFVAILAGYAAFTTTIADTFFPQEVPVMEEETVPLASEPEEDEPGFLASLPSRISDAIPDILLRSAEYQSAALATATELPEANTTDPLEALVNVFCTLTTEEYIRTTTGTGFFVDEDGVILTNAHVAQFLLLEEAEEGSTECVVRAGNPATPTYVADLLYLPPAWIQANAAQMYEAMPMGTGERDYALLYVSERVDGAPLPARFPALPLRTELLPISVKDDTVIAAGYPAQNLQLNGPSADLIPVRAETSVSELYTFGSNYADVISVRGSAVGAEGASGGPIVNEDGEVIGIIVTRGDDSIDGAGSLRAITISHINRTIEQETGFGLNENLSGDLRFRADIFAETLSPFLLRLLELERPE